MSAEIASQTTSPALGWSISWSEASTTPPQPANDLPVGREELFQEIYAHYLPIVFKTARAFAYSKEDREDLAQEILVALWEAADQYEARGKLSTYVYMISYRKALNWKRGRRRYENKLMLFEREQPVGFDRSDRGDEDAKLEWLYQAIGSLKPIDRTICLLFLDGLTYNAIAEVIGMTETVVGVRVHRAKQQLVALLGRTGQLL